MCGAAEYATSSRLEGGSGARRGSPSPHRRAGSGADRGSVSKKDGLGFRSSRGDDENAVPRQTRSFCSVLPERALSRPVGEREGLLSNRKIREVLGFVESIPGRSRCPEIGAPGFTPRTPVGYLEKRKPFLQGGLLTLSGVYRIGADLSAVQAGTPMTAKGNTPPAWLGGRGVLILGHEWPDNSWCQPGP